MKTAALFALIWIPLLAEAQEFLDEIDRAFTLSVFNDNIRTRVSGTLDFEGYNFRQPSPGLIDSNQHSLFNPRLSFFLDAQAGPVFYLFLQARVDRGFDPNDGSAQARLDEYALRVTPWDDGRLTVEIGKFATVVGSFVSRHLSWDNPFVTAPLVYEYQTGLEDRTGRIADNFEHALGSEKYELIPVIWGPSYASGISIAGKLEKFEYAVEMKNTALSSRPETWNVTATGFENPTVSGRLGFRPDPTWNFGVSMSDGTYLRSWGRSSFPDGKSLGDYREKLIGQDITFAWHHLQIWSEVYEARFDVVRAGNADTLGWYLEAKYKITPQLFAALRWNQQFFNTVSGEPASSSFGSDLWRLDSAVAYRFTPQTQLKIQYSFQQETNGARNSNHLLAAQLTVRF